MIRHIIKQYNISSKELFTEYTLTIKQHKSHAKRRTVYRSEQEPTRQVPLWTLVQDPHTQKLQHKAALKKEAAGKKK